jgi:hypothetical protein
VFAILSQYTVSSFGAPWWRNYSKLVTNISTVFVLGSAVVFYWLISGSTVPPALYKYLKPTNLTPLFVSSKDESKYSDSNQFSEWCNKIAIGLLYHSQIVLWRHRAETNGKDGCRIQLHAFLILAMLDGSTFFSGPSERTPPPRRRVLIKLVGRPKPVQSLYRIDTSLPPVGKRTQIPQ